MNTFMRIGSRAVLGGVAATVCTTVAIAVTAFTGTLASHPAYRIEGIAAGVSLAVVAAGFALMIGTELPYARGRPARIANRFAQAMTWLLAGSLVTTAGLIGTMS